MSVFQIYLTVRGCIFLRTFYGKLVGVEGGAVSFLGGRGELGFDLGVLEGVELMMGGWHKRKNLQIPCRSQNVGIPVRLLQNKY